jgi:anti-sigma regulatory factor (Ser/Thr protein kinase)
MTACAGALARYKGWNTTGKVFNVPSVPYLVRMKLFEFLDIPAPREIAEHEEAGRFVPITQIRSGEDLSNAITNLIPLLHAARSVADPIRYVVSELGRNVLEHSQSPVGGFVCAQYYKDQKRIAIGMADAGVGIPVSIRRSHTATTDVDAFKLALTPGISGATPKIGGNETNAGAGLYFIRSIAKVSGNFFLVYSGKTNYKLLRKQTNPDALNADAFADDHKVNDDLPKWRGTAIGIDLNVDDTTEFSELLGSITKSYKIDVKAQQKAYYKKIKFT